MSCCVRSGVGLETTILMLREGASVLMADISQPALEKALGKVQYLVPTHIGNVEIAVCDVSKEAQVEALVAKAEPWGGVDIMFNNAGIMHPKDGDAQECPDNIWDLTFDINVKGVWYGSKHAVNSLRKNKKDRASIINTASMVAIVGSATPQVAYTASKGAVLALTRELAIVHAREGKVIQASNTAREYRSLTHHPLNRFPLQFTLPSASEVSLSIKMISSLEFKYS